MLGDNPGAKATWQRIPKNSVGVELGVWKGNSSVLFLKRAKHLHLVDSYSPAPFQKSYDDQYLKKWYNKYSQLVGGNTEADFKNYYNNLYEKVKKRFSNKPVTLHRKTTEDFFQTFNEKVDWIYVDADHGFEGCLQDLRNSIKIVKKGGYIFGDDYSDAKPGVKKAVDTFINETGLFLNNFYMDQFEIKVYDQ